ncbi:MAG: phosphoribosylformylglycinamidine synthase subunit PurQ [Bacteroidia bacterium]|nr:phosphoribosylformylglycinamidine synthase subunit PurQ [Bacteroidia bacterium]
MKFGVITFPGSNCDEDLIFTLRENLGQEVVNLWHKDTDLQGCDFVFLPGGFSYGDYLRSGAIARFSPIMNEVIRHAERGGYVMGICNGFQILTEAHLLDGALIHNNTMSFVCKNVWIKPATKNTILTRKLEDRAYKIPIAHGEGNFFCDQDTLKRIEDEDRVLFRYCDEKGQQSEGSNPNGSLNNIVGITNKGRNVFGMMPHPERAADPILKNIDGVYMLESLLSV